MVLGKLGGVWHGMFRYGAGVHWLISLSLALSIPFLWRGYAWLRWLVGVACVLSGGLALFAFGRSLADFSVPGQSLDVFAGVLGLVDILAGLAFLFLPSLQAFFRYQQVGPLMGMARDNRLPPTLANRPRSFSQLVAAGSWGLALGYGGGVLVSAHHVQSFGFDLGLGETVAIMLGGAAAGGVIGLVAGLAVGAARPSASQTNLRWVVTRGLVAAGACMITLAVVSAIWGGFSGFHPPPIYGPGASPGLEAAALVAVLSVVFLGLPIAVVGFALGAVVALLMRDS
jgi:hypothetical protein